ncbi:hypothetical protein NJ76_22250 [Rhodococcus sp. IITR03]|nr:hypothetical protein NJ76_22250 [Rhodococcus sp. IITR03]
MGNDGGSTERILQMCFLEGNPAESWQHIVDYAENIENSGAGHVTFASPFIPTVSVRTSTPTNCGEIRVER